MYVNRTYNDYKNDVRKVMGLKPLVNDNNNTNKDAEIKRLQKKLKTEKNNNANLRDRITYAERDAKKSGE